MSKVYVVNDYGGFYVKEREYNDRMAPSGKSIKFQKVNPVLHWPYDHEELGVSIVVDSDHYYREYNDLWINKVLNRQKYSIGDVVVVNGKEYTVKDYNGKKYLLSDGIWTSPNRIKKSTSKVVKFRRLMENGEIVKDSIIVPEGIISEISAEKYVAHILSVDETEIDVYRIE